MSSIYFQIYYNILKSIVIYFRQFHNRVVIMGKLIVMTSRNRTFLVRWRSCIIQTRRNIKKSLIHIKPYLHNGSLFRQQYLYERRIADSSYKHILLGDAWSFWHLDYRIPKRRLLTLDTDTSQKKEVWKALWAINWMICMEVKTQWFEPSNL